MAASVDNGHSEKRHGKRSMENGDCTFLASPVYKRRKVSAVRDFPEGCGPCASRSDPMLMVNITGCGSANGTIVEGKNGEHLGGDTVNSSEDVNGSANGTIVEDKNGEHLGGDTVKSSEVENDHQHSALKKDLFPTVSLGQNTDCSLNEEKLAVSSLQVEGPVAKDEPAKVPMVDVETLDKEFAGTANTVECDSSYTPNSSSLLGEVAKSGESKSLSLDNYISGSSACIKDPITGRDLPRRKVSAVRVFPSLCGHNAPCLSKNTCEEGSFSFDNNEVGEQNLAVDDTPLKKVADTDVKEVKKNIKEEYGCKGKLVDIIQTGFLGNATEKVKKPDLFEPPSPETKLAPDNMEETYVALPEKGNHQVKINSKAVVNEEDKVGDLVEGTPGQENIIYPGVQSLETKPLDMSSSRHKLKSDSNRLQVSYKRKVVLGLMASSKFKLIDDKSESKGKKVTSSALFDKSKTAVKTKGVPYHSGKKLLKKKKGNAASEGMGQLVRREMEDFLDPDENIEELQVSPRSASIEVFVPPISHSNFNGNEDDSNVTRNKVRQTLRHFQAVSRKILHEIESKLNKQANGKRIDLQAAKILKEKGMYVNTGKQILGSVPGVEVGDEFQYRVELNIVGVHRQIQGGIDYVKHNGKVLATSIVASGGYADDLDNSDVLVYTGQGGNVMNSDKEPEDQKLERGNLALKNSSEERNPVRVIRGYESLDSKCRTYVYDGLYVVESCWQDMGPHGKLVYKFRLRRIPGQPELALKEVKKSKKFKTREGLCVDDISYGKERIPICAVNTIDDEKPPPFKYITSMMYPNNRLTPPEGCDCTNGCSDLEKCSCVVKNGGEIPFNHNQAIIEIKSLVYECGPSCKCPSTCHNRASQHGIKFQLEIFKTRERGWGVRSLNSIPSGSFICEYIGELLEEKEAEERTGNDEYLFDIGNNYRNSNLLDGLSTLMPDAKTSSCEIVKDGAYTIDAAQFGNVGRFINHSCSPNLYAQNVLYDHHDARMPHIMFFAVDNIPPLQELSYDYNYALDQVYDSDGNIKKKYCYCGSAECSGRMY